MNELWDFSAYIGFQERSWCCFYQDRSTMRGPASLKKPKVCLQGDRNRSSFRRSLYCCPINWLAPGESNPINGSSSPFRNVNPPVAKKNILRAFMKTEAHYHPLYEIRYTAPARSSDTNRAPSGMTRTSTGLPHGAPFRSHPSAKTSYEAGVLFTLRTRLTR
jgi:hypothetical protein